MNNEKDRRPLPNLTRKHLSACPIVHRGHVLSPAIGIYFINRGHPGGDSRTKIVWIIFLMGLLHPLPRQTGHKKPRKKLIFEFWLGSGMIWVNDLSFHDPDLNDCVCSFQTLNTFLQSPFLSIEVICRDLRRDTEALRRTEPPPASN